MTTIKRSSKPDGPDTSLILPSDWNTAAEVIEANAAHRNATADAHAASAISVVDAGGLFTGTTVEAALAEAGRKVLVGSGSPLGVVTPAYVGQLYSDTAQTNGARLWVATTTASSGWQVAVGDTGWRNVSDLLEGDATKTMDDIVSIRRVGNIVEFVGGVNFPSWVSGATFITVPIGFRHERLLYLPPCYQNSDPITLVHTTGAMKRYATGSGNRRLSWAWTTNQAWPTTLPGTAV